MGSIKHIIIACSAVARFSRARPQDARNVLRDVLNDVDDLLGNGDDLVGDANPNRGERLEQTPDPVFLGEDDKPGKSGKAHDRGGAENDTSGTRDGLQLPNALDDQFDALGPDLGPNLDPDALAAIQTNGQSRECIRALKNLSTHSCNFTISSPEYDSFNERNEAFLLEMCDGCAERYDQAIKVAGQWCGGGRTSVSGVLRYLDITLQVTRGYYCQTSETVFKHYCYTENVLREARFGPTSEGRCTRCWYRALDVYRRYRGYYQEVMVSGELQDGMRRDSRMRMDMFEPLFLQVHGQCDGGLIDGSRDLPLLRGQGVAVTTPWLTLWIGLVSWISFQVVR